MKLLKRILDKIDPRDRSVAYLQRLDERANLPPGDIEALKSIEERIDTGVDGGYIPKKAYTEAFPGEITQLIENSRWARNSIQNWYMTRGFITAKQAKYLKKNQVD